MGMSGSQLKNKTPFLSLADIIATGDGRDEVRYMKYVKYINNYRTTEFDESFKVEKILRWTL